MKKFVADSLLNAELKEEYPLYLTYEVPIETIRLGELFELMESEKNALGIQDYSISQSSLEQIFVSMAANNE